MKRTIFVLAMAVVVAVVLAGGAAFIMQQNRNSDLRRLGAQAAEKLEAREYDDALQALRKIEAEGGTAQSAYLFGKALYEQGKLADSMKYFQRIEERHPKSGYVPMARLYRGRYGQEVEGKTKKAKDVYLAIIEKYPNTEAADYALLYLSKMSYEEGDVAQTKKNLDQLIKRTDSPARNEAEFILGDINMKHLRSPEIGPNDREYTIKKGDSLWKLERALNVPQNLLIGINGLNPKALQVGMRIKVPQLDVSIVVDKAQRTLTLRNHGQFLKKYHVGLNSVDTKVPPGDYTVQELHEKGQEFVETDGSRSYKPGEPDNPYGTRYIQLRRQLGIHGTHEPEKVGKLIAKGEIALTNQDVEEIFTFSRKQTPVIIKGHNLKEDNSSARK